MWKGKCFKAAASLWCMHESGLWCILWRFNNYYWIRSINPERWKRIPGWEHFMFEKSWSKALFGWLIHDHQIWAMVTHAQLPLTSIEFVHELLSLELSPKEINKDFWWDILVWLNKIIFMGFVFLFSDCFLWRQIA